jgi:hypothetical protein
MEKNVRILLEELRYTLEEVNRYPNRIHLPTRLNHEIEDRIKRINEELTSLPGYASMEL